MTKSSNANGKQNAGLLRASLGRVAFWAPVWVPLIVVYQMTLGGLKPTLAEGERVRGAEDEVQRRVDELEAERSDLELRRDMLGDPVYRERVERTRRRSDRKPLTLDEAVKFAESQD